MMKRHERLIRLLALPFLAMLAVLILWPMASVVRDSFAAGDHWSLSNYATILKDAYYRQSFINAIAISLLSTAVGLLLGFLSAVSLRHRAAGIRRAAMAFANIGANFAGVPLAMAMIFLLGLNGMLILILKGIGLPPTFNLYSATGLIIAYCYFQVALATLLLIPALEAIAPELEEAATLMGAGPVRFWLRIGLPGAAHQLLAIAMLLFANAMGTYATTQALTGTSVNVVTVRIGELVSGDIFSDPHLANAIAILLFVVLLVPIVASQIFAQEKNA